MICTRERIADAESPLFYFMEAANVSSDDDDDDDDVLDLFESIGTPSC